MSEAVLDASAILAYLQGERGGDRVVAYLPGALVSTVNLAEVLTKLCEAGAPAEEAAQQLARLEFAVVPFDAGHARLAASLRESTKARGLSLGDRCCLALGMATGAKVLTADRSWPDLDIGIAIELIRQAH